MKINRLDFTFLGDNLVGLTLTNKPDRLIRLQAPVKLTTLGRSKLI